MARNAACSLTAAVVVAVLFAACGGGGTKSVARTAPAAVAPNRTAVAVTGISALDQVLGAAIAADTIELAGLTGYAKVACKKDSSEEPDAPPLCRENEPDGAQVEVLPATACDNRWVRPEQVPDVFEASLQAEPELLAVVKPRVSPTTYGGGFGAEEAAIFQTGTHAEGPLAGVALHIKNGRVVWIEGDCHNLFELVAPEKVDSFLYNRGEVTPPPSPTPSAPSSTATPTQ